jgi:protein involved in polysaccharide export with SLBB domain
MKRAVFSFVLLAIVPAIVSAQTQSRQRLSSEQSTENESNTVRTRVVGPRASNHVDGQKARTSGGTASKSDTFTWGNVPISSDQTPRIPAASNNSSVAATKPPASLVQPTVFAPKATAESTTSRVVPAPRSPLSPSMYAVGIGDVLDIRLPNTTARESTLFTVLGNGAVEYPLLNAPLMVVGLTTDQISSLLAAQIKVIKTPKVNVSVRDYASHSFVISGLVDSAGKKVLRRESLPLYAILAEAAVRPEAISVTIIHNGKEAAPLSLKDERAMSTLIYSGDVIRVSGGNMSPGQYVYVGGDVTAPGEKTLRPGMTLTQLLISSGADLSTRKVAKIARRNGNGLLSTIDYDVNSIAQGKTPDPQILSGDRVEVKRGM